MQRWFFRIFVLVLMSLAFGLLQSVRKSDLFAIAEIQWRWTYSHAPRDEVAHVAPTLPVQIGKTSLLSLDLKLLEEKVKQDPWVRTVHVAKELPSTLRVHSVLRRPIAWVQFPSQKQASLQILDDEGEVFSPGVLTHLDLPLLIWPENPSSDFGKRIAARVLAWGTTFDLHSPRVLLAEISEDKDRGFSALVVREDLEHATRVRTRVRWESDYAESLIPLKQLFSMLSQRSVASEMIWVMSDKKMVVRTRSGS